jgi:hypothetical protein
MVETGQLHSSKREEKRGVSAGRFGKARLRGRAATEHEREDPA